MKKSKKNIEYPMNYKTIGFLTDPIRSKQIKNLAKIGGSGACALYIFLVFKLANYGGNLAYVNEDDSANLIPYDIYETDHGLYVDHKLIDLLYEDCPEHVDYENASKYISYMFLPEVNLLGVREDGMCYIKDLVYEDNGVFLNISI